MAGSWLLLLLLAFRVSSCIVATSGWASSEAFLVSRSQPFAFFSSFPFPDVVVFSGVWVWTFDVFVHDLCRFFPRPWSAGARHGSVFRFFVP